MAAIRNSQRWRQKPEGIQQINPSHPAAFGLSQYWLCNDKSAFLSSAVSANDILTLQNVSQATWTARFGGGIQLTNGGSSGHAKGTLTQGTSAYPSTIAIQATHENGPGGRGILCSFGNAADDNVWLEATAGSGSGTGIKCVFQPGALTLSGDIAAAGSEVCHTFCAVSRSSADHQLVADGLSLATSTTNVTMSALDKVAIGAYNGSGIFGPFMSGYVGWCAHWIVALDVGLLAELHDAPFAILMPRPARRSYFAGTSPPPPPPSTYIGARFQMIGSGIQQFGGGRAA